MKYLLYGISLSHVRLFFLSSGFTPDNIEPYMLSSLRGYTRLAEMEGFDEPKDKTTTSSVLKNARSALLQQTI